MHTFARWGALDDCWTSAMPGIRRLEAEFAARRTLVELAAAGAPLDDVLTQLWPEQTDLTGDVDALWTRA